MLPRGIVWSCTDKRSLTPELEKIVAEQVASGRYASASEVIREALRLLDERDQLNQLREDVRRGLKQLDQGRHRPFDYQAVERIKRQGHQQTAAAQQRADRGERGRTFRTGRCRSNRYLGIHRTGQHRSRGSSHRRNPMKNASFWPPLPRRAASDQI